MRESSHHQTKLTTSEKETKERKAKVVGMAIEFKEKLFSEERKYDIYDSTVHKLKRQGSVVIPSLNVQKMRVRNTSPRHNSVFIKKSKRNWAADLGKNEQIEDKDDPRWMHIRTMLPCFYTRISRIGRGSEDVINFKAGSVEGIRLSRWRREACFLKEEDKEYELYGCATDREYEVDIKNKKNYRLTIATRSKGSRLIRKFKYVDPNEAPRDDSGSNIKKRQASSGDSASNSKKKNLDKKKPGFGMIKNLLKLNTNVGKYKNDPLGRVSFQMPRNSVYIRSSTSNSIHQKKILFPNNQMLHTIKDGMEEESVEPEKVTYLPIKKSKFADSSNSYNRNISLDQDSRSQSRSNVYSIQYPVDDRTITQKCIDIRLQHAADMYYKERNRFDRDSKLRNKILKLSSHQKQPSSIDHSRAPSNSHFLIKKRKKGISSSFLEGAENKQDLGKTDNSPKRNIEKSQGVISAAPSLEDNHFLNPAILKNTPIRSKNNRYSILNGNHYHAFKGSSSKSSSNNLKDKLTPSKSQKVMLNEAYVQLPKTYHHRLLKMLIR